MGVIITMVNAKRTYNNSIGERDSMRCGIIIARTACGLSVVLFLWGFEYRVGGKV